MNKKDVTQEFRKKRSEIMKQMWKDKKYKEHMSNAHKGQKPWNKGIKFQDTVSEETRILRKKKISDGLKEAYKKNKRTSLKGRIVSEETRLKISQAIKQLYDKGILKQIDLGKTSERTKAYASLKYQLWRNKLFKRDKYTCQDCGQIGKELNAHHILFWSEFPKLRYDLGNGVTLCRGCHIECHTN